MNSNNSSFKRPNRNRSKRQEEQPMSPTSVLATQQFERLRKLSSDFSISSALSAGRSREYLPTVVFSSDSPLAADQKRSHRRLVSYDDMEELNKKLQEIMVEPRSSTPEEDEQAQQLIEDLLSLHMPKCQTFDDDDDEDDGVEKEDELPDTPEPVILPRPRLLRSDDPIRRLFGDNDSHVDDDEDEVEDDLELLAKRFQQRQKPRPQQPSLRDHLRRRSSHSDLSAAAKREAAANEFGSSGYHKRHLSDELLNKEITIVRALPEPEKRNHRRMKSMAGLWSAPDDERR